MDLMQRMGKIGVNHLALMNSAGTRVVAFNKARNTLKSKYAEIVNYLSAYPSEQFQLIGKKDIRSAAVMDEFVSYEALQGLPEPSNLGASMSDAIEVEKLRLRIEALEKEKEDNEMFIEELTEQLENGPANGLAEDSPPAWVETLITVVGGLAEKFLDQRSQMIELEKRKQGLKVVRDGEA